MYVDVRFKSTYVPQVLRENGNVKIYVITSEVWIYLFLNYDVKQIDCLEDQPLCF